MPAPILNTSVFCAFRLESTASRECSNAEVVQELRQGAESRLQAMDAAVSSSLLQQQELYSSIQHMTAQVMQQKGTDVAALQVRNCLFASRESAWCVLDVTFAALQGKQFPARSA